MAKEKRRGGRPTKVARKGSRVILAMTVTAELKNTVDRAARAYKRTQGQIAEILIERCLVYDRLLKVAEMTMEEITAGHVAKAFELAGYVRKGDAWVRGDQPGEVAHEQQQPA